MAKNVIRTDLLIDLINLRIVSVRDELKILNKILDVLEKRPPEKTNPAKKAIIHFS